jgi:hypothetical protein
MKYSASRTGNGQPSAAEGVLPLEQDRLAAAFVGSHGLEQTRKQQALRRSEMIESVEGLKQDNVERYLIIEQVLDLLLELLHPAGGDNAPGNDGGTEPTGSELLSY